MPSELPRTGVTTYEKGDTDWDHTDLAESHDELAIERGSIADRPSEGDYDDELYLAVDQQILWRWDDDESDWIAEGHGTADDPVPSGFFESLTTEDLAIDEYIKYAANDSALDQLTIDDEHVVILGDSDFSDNRIFNERAILRGKEMYGGPQRVTGDWTFEDRCSLSGIRFTGDNDLEIKSDRSVLTNISNDSGQTMTFADGSGGPFPSRLSGGFWNGDVVVEDDNILVEGGVAGDVTFASGTEGGLVDSCTNTSVTDNGNNTVGDIG